jgi:2-dehydropantoate 2-reductase
MAVAAARGVRPVGFNGFEPAAFAAAASESASRRSIAALAEFNRHTAKTHSGIYRDLAVRKRRTEVDAQIGIIVTLGAQAGVPTPALARLVELIHDIEENRRALAAENIGELARACR